MIVKYTKIGETVAQLNARIAQLEAELAEERNHAEQYRQNWLALQEATGEDCQQRALEVIREARKDGERLDWLHKHMAHVFEWISGKFGVESRSGHDHWLVKPIYDTPRAAIDAARGTR